MVREMAQVICAVAANPRLLSDTYFSPLRARHGAAKPERWATRTKAVDHEQLTLLLLVVMVATATAIPFWTRRVYREFPVAAGTKWLAGHERMHLLGCAVFFMLGPVALLAYFWPVALLFGLIFLALAGRRLILRSQADREIAGVLILCAVVWLAFAGHEAQLHALIAGATSTKGVGGLLAADFLITAPLLYFTGVVGLALGTDRKWFKRGDK